MERGLAAVLICPGLRKFGEGLLQFRQKWGKMGDGNINAAGRGVVATPHGPVRVDWSLSTAVKLHHGPIIPVSRSVCKSGGRGFMGVRSHDLMRC